MTDNKIAENEVLNNEQLENVAGGYGSEIENDIERLIAVSELPEGTSTNALINGGLAKHILWDRFRIDVNTSFADSNQYSYEGRPISRREAWGIICAKKGMRAEKVFWDY